MTSFFVFFFFLFLQHQDSRFEIQECKWKLEMAKNNKNKNKYATQMNWDEMRWNIKLETWMHIANISEKAEENTVTINELWGGIKWKPKKMFTPLCPPRFNIYYFINATLLPLPFTNFIIYLFYKKKGYLTYFICLHIPRNCAFTLGPKLLYICSLLMYENTKLASTIITRVFIVLNRRKLC